MPDIRVVLVGPKFEGNVGAVARCMANFDVTELYLVNPCELGDTAFNRSKHCSQILENAITGIEAGMPLDTAAIDIREALSRLADITGENATGCFLVVGTSGVTTKGDKNYTRIPVPVREFAESARGYDEKIALVFGREDIGLLQTELNRCDVLITIPASEEYPIMNLSHSVGVVLYEMFQSEHVPKRCLPADSREKELMFQFFGDLLEEIGYMEARREATTVMFRRMMGRSIPTKYEYNTIMGVFGDAAKIIRAGGTPNPDFPTCSGMAFPLAASIVEA